MNKNELNKATDRARCRALQHFPRIEGSIEFDKYVHARIALTAAYDSTNDRVAIEAARVAVANTFFDCEMLVVHRILSYLEDRQDSLSARIIEAKMND